MCLDAFLGSHKNEDNNLTMAQRDGYLWCSSFRTILRYKQNKGLSGNLGTNVIGYCLYSIGDELNGNKESDIPFGSILNNLDNNYLRLTEKRDTHYICYYLNNANIDDKDSHEFAFARVTIPRETNEEFLLDAAGGGIKYIEKIEQDTYNMYFFFYNKEGKISDEALFIPLLKTDSRIPEDKKSFAMNGFTATLKKFPSFEIEYQPYVHVVSEQGLLASFNDIVKHFKGEQLDD